MVRTDEDSKELEMVQNWNEQPEPPNQEEDDRLVAFEREWKRNGFPDIRPYLVQQAGSGARYLIELVGIDLESRWKRYSSTDLLTARDDNGFPLFPTLEDYTVFEGLSEDILFTVEMIIKEYRSRVRWGDQPERISYLVRFPRAPSDLQAALSSVESELHDDQDLTHDSQLQATRPFVASGISNQQEVSPPADPQAVSQLNRYELVSHLGSGGFGEVWKAYDPRLKRHVAIKFPRRDKSFPPRVLEAFAREGEKLAALGQIPGVVTVHDTGEWDGRPYIVSELIEGESLGQRRKRSPLPREASIRIVIKVARALHHVHLRDYVHRDIKPGNILIDRDDNPILADFGLAVTEYDQLMESEGVVGTLPYMPPEQITGKSHLVNAQADIYSLGVVLYQLLTGRLPFVATTREEYKEQIPNRPPRSPRTIDDTIPLALSSICLKCLAKAPEDRYSSALDLADALQQFADAQTKSEQRAGFLIPIVACLFVLIVVLGGVYWSPPPTRSTAKSDSPGKVPPDETRFANEWIRRLGEPRELHFPGRLGKGHFAFEQDEPASLSVATDSIRLIQFGTITEGDFTLSLEIRQLDWRGTPGLFFGYREGRTDGEDSVEFQHFRIASIDDQQQTLIVTRQKTLITKRNQVLFPLSAKMSPRVHFSGRQPRLELRVEKGMLKQIKLGETSLPILHSSPVNKTYGQTSFRGPWGGVSEKGTTWFVNPVLTVERSADEN